MAPTAWCMSHASRLCSVFSVFSQILSSSSLSLPAAISLALGEHVGGLIIIAIVLFSVLLNFLMEFQARHAVEEIQKQIATTAAVMRDGHEQELPIAELVPGDMSGSRQETWCQRTRAYWT